MLNVLGTVQAWRVTGWWPEHYSIASSFDGTELFWITISCDNPARFAMGRCAGSRTKVRLAGLEQVRDGRKHSRLASGVGKEPRWEGRVGLYSCRCQAFYLDISTRAPGITCR